MDMEYIHIVMEMYMKDIIKKVFMMENVYINMPMAIYTMGIIKMI